MITLLQGDVRAQLQRLPAESVACRTAPDPIGLENDRHILEVAREAGSLLCAWGNDGALFDRAAQVYHLLRGEGVTLHALRVSATGEPCHPLYLPARLELRPYRREGAPL